MDQAKIEIKHTCAVCNREISFTEYVDPYKEMQVAEVLYRNGAYINVQIFLEMDANDKENHLKLMEIPELCRECQQKLGQSLKDACNQVLNEFLPCSLVDKFKREQEG